MIVFDLLVVVGSLVIVAFLFGYARPLVIAPLEGATEYQNELFVFDKDCSVFVSDNINFIEENEITVNDGSIVEIDEGTQYWKIVCSSFSDIRTITAISDITLKFMLTNENIKVVNADSSDLTVDVYDDSTKVNTFSLGLAEAQK